MLNIKIDDFTITHLWDTDKLRKFVQEWAATNGFPEDETALMRIIMEANEPE